MKGLRDGDGYIKVLKYRELPLKSPLIFQKIAKIYQMVVQVYPNYESLSEATARCIAEVVHQKPNAVLCLASGNSPEGVFKQMVGMAQRGEADFSQCIFIGLDEWLGIAPDNTGSCWYMVNESLFKPLQIPANQIYFFDGLTTTPQAECERIDQKVAELGGLDVILVGVGLNGHIAMNEPGRSWDLYSHVSELHESTITVGQKYFKESTPLQYGLTVGLRYVQEAKLLILIANGTKKAAILRTALHGEVTTQVPASLFQQLVHGLVMLDQEAASELDTPAVS